MKRRVNERMNEKMRHTNKATTHPCSLHNQVVRGYPSSIHQATVRFNPTRRGICVVMVMQERTQCKMIRQGEMRNGKGKPNAKQECHLCQGRRVRVRASQNDSINDDGVKYVAWRMWRVMQ